MKGFSFESEVEAEGSHSVALKRSKLCHPASLILYQLMTRPIRNFDL